MGFYIPFWSEPRCVTSCNDALQLFFSSMHLLLSKLN